MIASLAVLWVAPILLFQNPGANDAIWLANLELLILLLGLVGLIAVLIIRRRDLTMLGLGVGVYLLGVGADFLIGELVFGNTSNDRFLPLLFLPFPTAAPGLLAIVLGLTVKRPNRAELVRGARYGLAGAAFVCIWVLIRGARDWLLAPYGFDIIVLIPLVGVAVGVAGGQVRRAGPGG